MTVHVNSRYAKTGIYRTTHKDSDKSILVFKRRNLFKLKEGDEVFKHEIVKGDTLDYLAFEYLGDSNLWWAILDSNPRYMSILEINIGDIINVPTPNTLRKRLR